jgi:CheY-like chemotaxis protein
MAELLDHTPLSAMQRKYVSLLRRSGRNMLALMDDILDLRDASASLRILLVEDNPVNQLYGQALLEQLGHEVHVAEDGLQAVHRVREREYDLILMDCQMPLLDGFDATRRIRRMEQARGSQRHRIVALTASAMTQDREKCLAAGMDAVLAKPFSRDEMKAVLADRAAHTQNAFG